MSPPLSLSHSLSLSRVQRLATVWGLLTDTAQRLAITQVLMRVLKDELIVARRAAAAGVRGVDAVRAELARLSALLAALAPQGEMHAAEGDWSASLMPSARSSSSSSCASSSSSPSYAAGPGLPMAPTLCGRCFGELMPAPAPAPVPAAAAAAPASEAPPADSTETPAATAAVNLLDVQRDLPADPAGLLAVLKAERARRLDLEARWAKYKVFHWEEVAKRDAKRKAGKTSANDRPLADT